MEAAQHTHHSLTIALIQQREAPQTERPPSAEGQLHGVETCLWALPLPLDDLSALPQSQPGQCTSPPLLPTPSLAAAAAQQAPRDKDALAARLEKHAGRAVKLLEALTASSPGAEAHGQHKGQDGRPHRSVMPKTAVTHAAVRVRVAGAGSRAG